MPMSPEVILEFPHLVGTLLRVPICELDQAALAVRALEPASVNPALGDKQIPPAGAPARPSYRARSPAPHQKKG